MQKFLSKGLQRVVVVCLVFVMLFGTTVQAASNYHRVRVHPLINNTFEIEHNYYVSAGSSERITITELRSDVEIDQVIINDQSTGAETVLTRSDLTYRGSSQYSFDISVNADLLIVVFPDIKDPDIYITELVITTDPCVYNFDLLKYSYELIGDDEVITAWFLSDDTANFTMKTFTGTVINTATLDGQNITAGNNYSIDMSTDHSLELRAKAESVNVWTTVYYDDSTNFDLVEFSGVSNNSHPYGDPIDYNWEVEDGYRIVDGYFKLYDPITLETSIKWDLVDEEGIMTGYESASLEDCIDMVVYLEDAPIYTLTSSSNLHNIDVLISHDIDPSTDGSQVYEGSEVNIDWTLEDGYILDTLNVHYYHSDGSFDRSESFNGADTGSLITEVYGDVEYEFIIEYNATTDIGVGITPDIGATYSGDGSYNTGDEITVSFTPEPGFEIISIGKSVNNTSTGEHTFNIYTYDELSTDSFTAGDNNIDIYYHVEALPIDDYLFTLSVLNDEAEITGLTKETDMNRYYGVFSEGEAAVIDIDANNGYWITELHDSNGDVIPEAYPMQSYQFNMTMSDHFNGFAVITHEDDEAFDFGQTDIYCSSMPVNSVITTGEGNYIQNQTINVEFTAPEGYYIDYIQKNIYYPETEEESYQFINDELSDTFLAYEEDAHVEYIAYLLPVDNNLLELTVFDYPITATVNGLTQSDSSVNVYYGEFEPDANAQFTMSAPEGYYIEELEYTDGNVIGGNLLEPNTIYYDYSFDSSILKHMQISAYLSEIPTEEYAIELQCNVPEGYEDVIAAEVIMSYTNDDSKLAIDHYHFDETIDINMEIDKGFTVLGGTIEYYNQFGELYETDDYILGNSFESTNNQLIGNMVIKLDLDVVENTVNVTGSSTPEDTATINGLGTFNTFDTIDIDITPASGKRITEVSVTKTLPESEPIVETMSLTEFNSSVYAQGYLINETYDLSISVTTENKPAPPPSSGGGGGGGGFIPPAPLVIEDEILPEASPLFIFKPAINGYEDKTFAPEGLITRAEAATMFNRILVLEEDGSVTFTDVAEDHWALTNIGTMQAAELIKGYEDKTYKPSNNITKAEFATIISRVMDMAELEVPEGVECPYTDIDGHWAEAAIQKLYSYGIKLDRDGESFNPDQEITRAEAVVLLNLLIGREINADDYTVPTYTDVPKTHWAYDHIEAASQETE